MDELKAAAAIIEPARLRAIEIVTELGRNSIGNAHYNKIDPDIARLEISNDKATLKWVYALEYEGDDSLSHCEQSFPTELLISTQETITTWIEKKVVERNIQIIAKEERCRALEEAGRRNFIASMPEVIKDLLEQQKIATGQNNAIHTQILEVLAALNEGRNK